MILELCRHRDRRTFECAVACMDHTVSEIAGEVEATGVPVLAGPAACREAVRWADLVNVHWWAHDPELLAIAGGKPHVTTLHWQLVAPPIPALTICTSEYVRRIQPDRRRFVAIPNGVDLERFRPAAPPAREVEHREEVVITRVCRTPKCAPYFWDVVHRLLADYPQVRVRIVGNTEPAGHPSGRVEFLGQRRDIPEILRSSDIFLYTPYPEIGTKDLVVMEASAAGVPSVVSDVSVVRESVEHGRNGFRISYGDVEATARAVGRLVEDRELRRRMGAAAAEMAREQFDIRRTVWRYEAVYRGTLAAHGRPGA